MEQQRLAKMISQFNRIHSQFTAVKRTLSCESGGDVLFPAEMQILILLKANPGISISEIGRLLYITRSASSQMIKKLNSKKYISKTRDLSNERNVILNLTEKGERAVMEFTGKESTVFGRFVSEMSHIDEKEITVIENFLDKLEVMFEEKLTNRES